MLHRYLITPALFLLAVPASAAPLDVPAGIYKSDPAHTSLTWRIQHLGLSFYTARFNSSEATLDLNSAKPELSTVSLKVDPKSVKTNYPLADKKDFDAEIITEPGFLEADKYPTIGFKSTRLAFTGPNMGTMTGDLTLHGITRSVTFNVTLNGTLATHPFSKKAALGISASGTIKRSDFGITAYQPQVGDKGLHISDEVQVLFESDMLLQ